MSNNSDRPPLWAQNALRRFWSRLEAKVGADRLPAEPDAKVYGCGHYGCVWPTASGQVLKITSDATEASLVAAYLAMDDRPQGIVRYHSIYRLDGLTHYQRPVFLIWRDEAWDVGGLIWLSADIRHMGRGEGGTQDEEREARRTCHLLDGFNAHADVVRRVLGGVTRRRGTEAEHVVAERIFNTFAEIDYEVIESLISGPSDWRAVYGGPFFNAEYAHNLTGEYRARAHLSACWHLSTKMTFDNLTSTRIGLALKGFLEEGILLADVHLNNIGKIKIDIGTEDERLGWGITDPGHAVFLVEKWRNIEIRVIDSGAHRNTDERELLTANPKPHFDTRCRHCNSNSRCFECHFKFEEQYALQYLPEFLRRRISEEHEQIRSFLSVGVPKRLLAAHAALEEREFPLYLPVDINATIAEDHADYAKSLSNARRNTDERLRAAERRYRRTGDPTDMAQALDTALRYGAITEEQIEWLAAFGYPGASLLITEWRKRSLTPASSLDDNEQASAQRAGWIIWIGRGLGGSEIANVSSPNYEGTSAAIDAALNAIVDSAFRGEHVGMRSMAILAKYRGSLDLLSRATVPREELTSSQLLDNLSVIVLEQGVQPLDLAPIPDTYNADDIINPDGWRWSTGINADDLYRAGFASSGHWIWASSFEEAIEELVGWAEDNAPGYLGEPEWPEFAATINWGDMTPEQQEEMEEAESGYQVSGSGTWYPTDYLWGQEANAEQTGFVRRLSMIQNARDEEDTLVTESLEEARKKHDSEDDSWLLEAEGLYIVTDDETLAEGLKAHLGGDEYLESLEPWGYDETRRGELVLEEED